MEGSRHGGPDGLSRRGIQEGDSEESDPEDFDEALDADLMCVRVAGSSKAPSEKFGSHGWVAQNFAINVNEFPQPYRDYAEYLTTFNVPQGVSGNQKRRFIRQATRFLIYDGKIWRRGRANEPPRRVIFNNEKKAEIVRTLHDESGHRGREGTYRKISLRYWWDGMYKNVKMYVQSCEQSQKRSPVKPNEPLQPTTRSSLWRKVGLDVVHMPKDEGYGYLAVMRDDLSGWSEAELMRKNNPFTMAKFIKKCVH